MVNDYERREVARRLREIEKGVIGAFIPTRELAENVLKTIDYGHSGAMTPYGCLADLIEPGEPKVKCVAEVKVDGERLEKLAHDAAVELTGIDRDALLALADEMKRMPQCELCPAEIVDCSAHPDGCPDALLDYYARRIREALGVK